MRFKIIPPSERLNRYIKHYWVMETDASEGDVAERVIPSDHVQLMFHYKKPFVVKQQDQGPVNQPASIVSGISNTYFDVSTQGEAGVIAVSFHPAGACHFFPFPLQEMENQSLDLRLLFQREIAQLEEQIGNEANMAGRIRLIETFLWNQWHPVKPHDFMLIETGIDLIRKAKGQIHARALSEALFVTPKSLERKFSALLGKTPKQYIKLVRFQEVLRDLSRNQTLSFTEQAYQSGYFDQSHFIHDFKNYSGFTPGEFLTHCNATHLQADLSP